MAIMRTQIHGRRFGLGKSGELVTNEKRVTSPAIGATIAVAATSTSPRAVTLQLTDMDGANLAEITKLQLIVFSSTAKTALSSGGSTGLAASVGILTALVSKTIFHAVTDANGAMTMSWTDTGTDAAYLVAVLPNGEMVGANAVMTIGV